MDLLPLPPGDPYESDRTIIAAEHDHIHYKPHHIPEELKGFALLQAIDTPHISSSAVVSPPSLV